MLLQITKLLVVRLGTPFLCVVNFVRVSLCFVFQILEMNGLVACVEQTECQGNLSPCIARVLYVHIITYTMLATRK